MSGGQSSTALVRYQGKAVESGPSTPNTISLPRPVFVQHPSSELAALQEVFPAPQQAMIPVRDRVSRVTRYLAIWNLPVYYYWTEVLDWLRVAVEDADWPEVTRILRTQEEGHQVYWLQMKSAAGARSIRGVLSQHRIGDSPSLAVSVVEDKEWNCRNSSYRDAWSKEWGMEIESRLGWTKTTADRQVLPADAHSRPLPGPMHLSPVPIPMVAPPVASSSSLTLSRQSPRPRVPLHQH